MRAFYYRYKSDFRRLILAAVIAGAFAVLDLSTKRDPVLAENMFVPFSKEYMRVISSLTSKLPFSLSELLLAPLLIGILMFTVRFLTSMRKRGVIRSLMSAASRLSLTAALIFAWYLLVYGFAYKRVPVVYAVGLEPVVATADQLAEATLYFAEKSNEYRKLAGNMDYGWASYSDVKDAVAGAVSDYVADKPYFGGASGLAKPVVSSRGMYYLEITGIFIPFLAEPNVNVAGPQYISAFAAAHELAHGQLVAKENEANFVAFLSLLESDDPRLKYSAYIHGLIYCGNALAAADRERYVEIYSVYPDVIKEDFAGYREFRNQFKGPVGELSSKVNDGYLKSMGQADGVISYGKVADLIMSWYLEYGGESK